MCSNADPVLINSFGQEWKKFTHANTPELEQRAIFDCYFAIFPWKILPKEAIGFDMGCGSGRWAYFVAPRVAVLHCIDPSVDALETAREKLRSFPNCRFRLASIGSNPLPDASADFGYALGVLHHLPDTQKGIDDCVRKLKPGAPLLLYLYYAFDNRPSWYRLLWTVTDAARRVICDMPFFIKLPVCNTIAMFLYWPLARFAKLCHVLHVPSRHLPLAAYRNRSMVFMRNDSLDRFGTRLERRFTRSQIADMMRAAGLEYIGFSESEPFWCAVGYKRQDGRGVEPGCE